MRARTACRSSELDSIGGSATYIRFLQSGHNVKSPEAEAVGSNKSAICSHTPANTQYEDTAGTHYTEYTGLRTHNTEDTDLRTHNAEDTGLLEARVRSCPWVVQGHLDFTGLTKV